MLDDNEHWLETIESILSPSYELVSFTDPEEAITSFKQNRYELAILDKNLPGVSGLIILKEMRMTAPNLRAIILTGYADVESAVESMKIGAVDYLSKGTAELSKVLQLKVEEALSSSSRNTSEQFIRELIASGESDTLEFKASARWDYRANKVNKELEKVILRTVASFLNAANMGNLLIGVDDDGRIIGLEADYRSTGKKIGRDSYENFLMTVLVEEYGKDVSPFIQIKFHLIDGHDICQIAVSPAPKPVFVKQGNGEHLFIRIGNSTRALSTREAVEYCKLRWK